MPVRALALILTALIATALPGCGSSSDDTTASQSSGVSEARVDAKSRARAAQLHLAARRQARIRARRARRTAIRQRQAEQRQAEAEARRAEEAEEAAAAEEASSECDPNYSGCLSPSASDYDCEGGSGDGPSYTGTVAVTGEDHHGLDSDSDGVGCETG